jgi:N utilization substance protein B
MKKFDNCNKKPLSHRGWARRYALQALYEWFISDNDMSGVVARFLEEKGTERFDRAYFQELSHEVPKCRIELDQALLPCLNCEPASVDPIEQIVLWIGMYELLKKPELSHRIVINEALELAKTFGATEGHKFVNGVLDKAYRVLTVR